MDLFSPKTAGDASSPDSAESGELAGITAELDGVNALLDAIQATLGDGAPPDGGTGTQAFEHEPSKAKPG